MRIRVNANAAGGASPRRRPLEGDIREPEREDLEAIGQPD
jgi:hypothetical protein